ncbi:MAG TPA: hypothetical protein VJZ71_11605 [Phycisphaerae bacterium]|nr:hypothetical protein [Phycisphaerae bacterium]
MKPDIPKGDEAQKLPKDKAAKPQSLGILLMVSILESLGNLDNMGNM